MPPHSPSVSDPRVPLQRLVKGRDNWSLGELLQALTILAHYHGVSSFMHGCRLVTDSPADAATNGRPAKNGRGGGGAGASHAPQPQQMVETRSLQRPRTGPPPGGDRSTYSLPRPGSQFSAATYHPGGERRSATLQRGAGGAGGPEPAPDFYFMPSQRKYSGEVVRVYVDYSKQQ